MLKIKKEKVFTEASMRSKLNAREIEKLEKNFNEKFETVLRKLESMKDRIDENSKGIEQNKSKIEDVTRELRATRQTDLVDKRAVKKKLTNLEKNVTSLASELRVDRKNSIASKKDVKKKLAIHDQKLAKLAHAQQEQSQEISELLAALKIRDGGENEDEEKSQEQFKERMKFFKIAMAAFEEAKALGGMLLLQSN